MRKHWVDDPTNSPLFFHWAATCEYCDREDLGNVSHLRGDNFDSDLINACEDCVDSLRRVWHLPLTYVDER